MKILAKIIYNILLCLEMLQHWLIIVKLVVLPFPTKFTACADSIYVWPGLTVPKCIVAFNPIVFKISWESMLVENVIM